MARWRWSGKMEWIVDWSGLFRLATGMEGALILDALNK